MERICERCNQPIKGIIYKAFFSQKEYCAQCKEKFKQKMSFMEIDNYELYEEERKRDPRETSNAKIDPGDSILNSL